MTLPLVLLPGMMCDARLFAPQVAAFGQDRDVRVLPLSEGNTIAAIARAVLAQAPPRFALAGLSMGGIVAMEIMEQAPERVDRLALMDTNPRAEAEEVRARRLPQIDKARNGRLRAVMRDEMKPNYLADGPQKHEILDLCMDMAMALGPEVFVAQSLALRDRADRCDTLRRVAVPALILCGEDDRLCPIERHELMHGLIRGSRLHIIPGAAHLPPLERPDATNAALAQWLAD